MKAIDPNSPKTLEYYSGLRTDVMPLLPKKIERALDVGCGNGVTGAFLKNEQGVAGVVGIEVVPAAAAAAQNKLDQVLCLDLNSITELPFPDHHFDLILCLDVLEHLIDPWRALKMLNRYLTPEGTIIVSVPNVRHFSISIPLLLQGKFEYQDSGLLDSTHLRFFTRRSAVSLVQGAGLSIRAVQHTGRPKWSETWFLNILTFGIFREIFDFQYVIAASKEAASIRTQ